jgi:hypothetical protein
VSDNIEGNALRDATHTIVTRSWIRKLYLFSWSGKLLKKNLAGENNEIY